MPINEDLKSICGEKPTDFNNKDDIQTKIRKIQENIRKI